MEVFDYIASKGSHINELVFIVFKEENGYSAVESHHSLMVDAKDRIQLIEKIKREVSERFLGKFKGKVIIREFSDEEIAI